MILYLFTAKATIWSIIVSSPLWSSARISARSPALPYLYKLHCKFFSFENFLFADDAVDTLSDRNIFKLSSPQSVNREICNVSLWLRLANHS